VKNLDKIANFRIKRWFAASRLGTNTFINSLLDQPGKQVNAKDLTVGLLENFTFYEDICMKSLYLFDQIQQNNVF